MRYLLNLFQIVSEQKDGGKVRWNWKNIFGIQEHLGLEQNLTNGCIRRRHHNLETTHTSRRVAVLCKLQNFLSIAIKQFILQQSVMSKSIVTRSTVSQQKQVNCVHATDLNHDQNDHNTNTRAYVCKPSMNRNQNVMFTLPEYLY